VDSVKSGKPSAEGLAEILDGHGHLIAHLDDAARKLGMDGVGLV
jgi:hypothetical protein